MSAESQRKARFTFNLAKDIFLLKTMLQVNPWEFGDHLWEEGVTHFKNRGWEVTERSLKERIKTLQRAYKMQTLPKTGTEEEKTERATLLDEISKCIDSAEVQKIMVIQRGATETEEDSVDNPESVDLESENAGSSGSGSSTSTITKKQLAAERADADLNRENALKAVADNSPPGPVVVRRKRSRLTEEDLMEKRQEHEMYMDLKRVELDECKEKRLREEGERRDELSKMQLALQRDQLEQQKLFVGVLSKLLEK